jgi:hypothetical protein
LITIEKKKEMAIVQGQYRERRGHTKEKKYRSSIISFICSSEDVNYI